MANVNVSRWDPLKLVRSFLASESATPGNSSAALVPIAWWVVPTIPRPDGAAAAAASGGSANVRFVVDKCTWQNGKTTSTVGGTFTVNLINASNSDGLIASLTIVSGAGGGVNASGDQVAMTISTTATTRNSVSVGNRVLLAGDIIALAGAGSNASDLIKIGSGIHMEGHWEEQLQIAS